MIISKYRLKMENNRNKEIQNSFFEKKVTFYIMSFLFLIRA